MCRSTPKPPLLWRMSSTRRLRIRHRRSTAALSPSKLLRGRMQSTTSRKSCARYGSGGSASAIARLKACLARRTNRRKSGPRISRKKQKTWRRQNADEGSGVRRVQCTEHAAGQECAPSRGRRQEESRSYVHQARRHADGAGGGRGLCCCVIKAHRKCKLAVYKTSVLCANPLRDAAGLSIDRRHDSPCEQEVH